MKKESNTLRGERMYLKSGVYFVHFDDIPLFVETAKAQGRYLAGDYDEITRKRHKNTYRAFSIDNGRNKRVGYWGTYELEDMNDWDDWDYTDEYIEHWQPNKKKVIL